jgi:neutral ceramidase
MSVIRFAAFLILLLGVSFEAAAKELYAGLARVEVTPPAVGSPMGGYAERKGPSTGIHDPLFATVLLLKSAETTIAIISCDLRSFPSERIVSLARERNLADHTLIAVTHNHSGPLTWEDKRWPSPDRPWFTETEDKILKALEQAKTQMFPARLAAGFDEIYLGHNRRQVSADGKVTMLWRNVERAPTAPLDPTIGVIRIDDATGKPRALIVNYACHAVVLGPDNRLISADYPGYLARKIEREFDGVMCLFIQGGAGDVNPYLDKQPVEQNGFGEAEKMGNALAEAVIKTTIKLKPQVNDNASILAASEVVNFRDRWNTQQTVRAGLTTLLINKQIAIATIPGEPFVDFQIALRDRSEVRYTFLFGYTYSAGGEWIGYVPTIRSASEGGYGAGYNTRIEVGAGEAMIDKHIVNLFTLTGRLTASPSR